MVKLKILVVDDNEQHRKAALKQLKKHDLTVLSSYSKAKDEICYGERRYDVLLTDLQMPARSDVEERSNEPEHIHAIGVWLVLLAATKGIKFVGLATDVNHHFDPASDVVAMLSNWHYATLDKQSFKGEWQFLKIGETRVMFIESPHSPGKPKDWAKLLGNLLRGTSE